MVLTDNEKKVLRLLGVSHSDHSINDIAKIVGITPNGAYKLLKKFEKEGVLKAKQIANIKAYRLDFDSEKTAKLLELAFMPDMLEGRVKSRAQDLQQLKAAAKACIIFGSYITTKKEPGDLDVLFVIKKSEFSNYKRILGKVQDIIPVKIQDVVQTTEDLQQNLGIADPVIIEALSKGVVLWGFDIIVEVIKNAYK